jgi:hypothetical protein
VCHTLMGACCVTPLDPAAAPIAELPEAKRARRIRAWKHHLYYYDPSPDKSASELIAILLLEANIHAPHLLHASETHVASFLTNNDADLRLARILGKWQAAQRAQMGLPPLATGATEEGVSTQPLRVARL